MIKDRNKGISSITYNHLNLPTQIEFEGTTNKITYLYNAAGQKLKKTVVYSDSIKILDYLDGFQTEERGSRMPVGALATQLSNNEQNHTATLASFDLKILNFQSLTRPFGLKHSVYSVSVMFQRGTFPEIQNIRISLSIDFRKCFIHSKSTSRLVL
ncbi:MAG: hypothetical protein GX159_12350 [Flavobacteriaceae bacterium]|jgi:hypothetical protein|nr:hypothetical protein [Flavobacteriaceae bacterium]